MIEEHKTLSLLVQLNKLIATLQKQNATEVAKICGKLFGDFDKRLFVVLSRNQ